MTPHPTIEAIEALDLTKVTPFLLPRNAPRKQQAQAARALFKQLGLKGISVTVPTYSMACTVQVRLPRAAGTEEERQEWQTVYYQGGDVTTTVMGQVRSREHAAEKKLEELLDLAFPNHHDRSDYSSDYFDYRWSVR